MVTQKVVRDTLPSQDESTHLIWNFLPQRIYVMHLMPILETRSEVKVTVTRKRNGTIRHYKMQSHTKFPSEMHLHTKFGSPTSKKNKRCAPDTKILKTRSEFKVTVNRKWYVTLCHP